MASLVAIQADVQQAVRLARFSQDTLKELELDTITYNVKDKDGKTLVSYEGREKQETAQEEASNFDFTNPENGPHYVESVSNIDVPAEKTAFLTFVEGAKNEITIPLEELRNNIKIMGNAIDCERILTIIEDQVRAVIEYLKAMLKDAGNLGGQVDLTKVPGNPMKLVSWAKKFVGKYLAPNILALVELIELIATVIALVFEIIQAVTAAITNVLLCLPSVLDTVYDTLLDELNTVVGEMVPGLDTALSAVGTLQSNLSSITGKPPRFNTSGSVEQFLESATVENKAQLNTDINEFLLSPDEEAQLSANTMNSISGSIGPGLAANATLATTSLVAANCFTGDATIPGASTGGTNGKFEIITGKGSVDQVRYIVRNGIIEDVIVGL